MSFPIKPPNFGPVGPMMGPARPLPSLPRYEPPPAPEPEFEMNFQMPNPVTQPERFTEGTGRDGVYYVQLNGTHKVDPFSDHLTVSDNKSFNDHYSAYRFNRK